MKNILITNELHIELKSLAAKEEKPLQLLIEELIKLGLKAIETSNKGVEVGSGGNPSPDTSKGDEKK